MPAKQIDITNKKFNYLTALSYVDRRKVGNSHYHFWLFKCDCGKEKVINKNLVMTNNTKSCGCLHKKNINKKEFGAANFTHAYHYYKASAKKRNYEWNLTKEQFKNLTQQNCYYCNSLPNNRMNDKFCNGEYIYNGIDRFDNKKGYHFDNCVPCCKQCNIAKSSMTQKEFNELIKKIFYNLNLGV